MKDYTTELKRCNNTEDLISALFVAHYVEQMGDALLSISGAVISCNLGQPIDIDRYHSLRASVEQLAGLTFEQILLHEPPALVKETLNQLGKTLGSIWKETRTDTPVSADFMHQLSRRLDEVYAVHPEFRVDLGVNLPTGNASRVKPGARTPTWISLRAGWCARFAPA